MKYTNDRFYIMLMMVSTFLFWSWRNLTTVVTAW